MWWDKEGIRGFIGPLLGYSPILFWVIWQVIFRIQVFDNLCKVFYCLISYFHTFCFCSCYPSHKAIFFFLLLLFQNFFVSTLFSSDIQLAFPVFPFISIISFVPSFNSFPLLTFCNLLLFLNYLLCLFSILFFFLLYCPTLWNYQLFRYSFCWNIKHPQFFCPNFDTFLFFPFFGDDHDNYFLVCLRLSLPLSPLIVLNFRFLHLYENFSKDWKEVEDGDGDDGNHLYHLFLYLFPFLDHGTIIPTLLPQTDDDDVYDDASYPNDWANPQYPCD